MQVFVGHGGRSPWKIHWVATDKRCKCFIYVSCKEGFKNTNNQTLKEQENVSKRK